MLTEDFTSLSLPAQGITYPWFLEQIGYTDVSEKDTAPEMEIVCSSEMVILTYEAVQCRNPRKYRNIIIAIVFK
jgi:hypothetical protein